MSIRVKDVMKVLSKYSDEEINNKEELLSMMNVLFDPFHEYFARINVFKNEYQKSIVNLISRGCNVFVSNIPEGFGITYILTEYARFCAVRNEKVVYCYNKSNEMISCIAGGNIDVVRYEDFKTYCEGRVMDRNVCIFDDCSQFMLGHTMQIVTLLH